MKFKTDIQQIIDDFCSKRTLIKDVIFSINETSEDTSIEFTIRFSDSSTATAKISPFNNALKIKSETLPHYQSKISLKNLEFEKIDFISEVETTIKNYYIQKGLIVNI